MAELFLTHMRKRAKLFLWTSSEIKKEEQNFLHSNGMSWKDYASIAQQLLIFYFLNLLDVFISGYNSSVIELLELHADMPTSDSTKHTLREGMGWRGRET